MSQATIDGPREHPLSRADRITSIESDPATWIYDGNDRPPCAECGAQIPLASGDYIVATLSTDRGEYRETSLVRVCSEGRYREWATDAAQSGWK